MFSIVVTTLCLILLASLMVYVSRLPAPDEQCKKFYGKEYTYISGGRSPDLCVTKDGKVRYYSLIR